MVIAWLVTSLNNVMALNAWSSLKASGSSSSEPACLAESFGPDPSDHLAQSDPAQVAMRYLSAGSVCSTSLSTLR